MLDITDVSIKVDGDRESADEGGGKIDVKPGSVIDMTIKVENLFQSSTDMTIEDVDIIGTIYDIDDGDEIEEESDEFDIDADDRETVKLEFRIPLEVDDENFEMLLDASGYDDNGTFHKEIINYTVSVDKESHQLYVEEANLVRKTVKCGESTSVDLAFINIGKKDEEGEVKITNDMLEIFINDSFDLDSKPHDDDNNLDKTYNILVKQGIATGIYPIKIEIIYDDGDEIETITEELTVESCAGSPPITQNTQTGSTQTTQTQTIQTSQPQTGESEVEVILAPQPPRIISKKKESSFLEENKVVIGIVAAELIIIALAAAIFLRRK